MLKHGVLLAVRIRINGIGDFLFTDVFFQEVGK